MKPIENQFICIFLVFGKILTLFIWKIEKNILSLNYTKIKKNTYY